MTAITNTNIANKWVDNKSFALLRTNPKLTTNAKLVVDSTGEIFLSAFRANKELSRIQYQKYEISSSGVYSDDLAMFYRGLPSAERYQTLKNYTDTTVFSDYRYQYEDQYQYGAIHNSSKLYGEQYRLFAPIWLDKKIPSKFIVYRVEDVDYIDEYAEDNAGQAGRISELLKNATIVKTFDLGNTSKIGKYLNNHVNDKSFPEAAITVNFEQGEQSTFNGIDLNNGGFTSKAEQFDNYYTQVDYPEFFSNQIITQGFERNNLAIANVINMEFMFDDYGAEDYKIYRYFGIYADELLEGSFKSDGMNAKGHINVNVESYSSQYDLTGTVPTLVDIDMLPLKGEESNIPLMRWVKDKYGEFYNLIGAKYDASTTFCQLSISNNGKRRDVFEGYAKSGKQVVYSANKPKYRGFVKFTVTDVPATNDILFIGDKTEIEISNYNLGDYLLIADNTVAAGKADGNRFSNQGSLQQIAIAISAAIENGEVVPYSTTVDGTSVIVEDFMSGYQRRQTAFAIYSLNFSTFIEIEYAEANNIGLVDSIVPVGVSTVFSDWNIYTMIGGSVEGQSVLVESKEIGNISVGEFVKAKDTEVFITIKEIVKDPFVKEVWRVILDKPVKITNDNLFEVYEVYFTKHGLFSAYDFKDFDFDLYSTRNSQLGDLLLDEEYDISTGDPIRNVDTFYAGLTGILEPETIDENTQQERILNEYDRLKENELKETAVLSRVVPTICKFELVNASNARNLPYILNVNEAFGEDNLSPNIEIDSKRKVEFLNMEHFHINNIPATLYGSRQDFNNYVDFAGDGGLTIDKLTDTSFDYFERHFNWNGYYDDTAGMWYDNSYKRLWSKFDKGNIEKNSSAVFRGLRYSYLKRKETTSQVPTEFIADKNVNDFRFGVVFRYNNGIDTNGATITQNSVNFNSIKNDKFKFICILIELNVVLNETAFIDRYLAYMQNDIKVAGSIIDTTIPFFIDFASPDSTFVTGAGNEDVESILSAGIAPISAGTAKFTEHITPMANGDFSWIYFTFNSKTWAVKVTSIVDDTAVKVQGWAWEFDLLTGSPVPAGTRLDPTQYPLINTTFKYYRGGENGFDALLNQVNAFNMAKRFNQYGEINYVTIDTEGNTILNDYVLSIESGVDIIKPSLVLPESDPDRPRAYRSSANEIGSVIRERSDGGYITLLRRMNGNYNPLFNSIITFSDIYPDNKVVPDGSNRDRERVIYETFNEKGLAFDAYKLNNVNYGYIENYFFHKTNVENSNNVLKLSSTSDKLPLYPKIGEVAIDKKNINMFKSKYSADYYTRSLAGFSSEQVHGTLSPVEKKNFMVSTIMKVKDVYDITRYTNKSETSIEELDRIRINATNTESIHWYEDSSQIVADVYLQSAILSELLEDGIYNKFKKYIDPANSFGDKETILDDLEVYVKDNISTRFIIDLIAVYGIEEKSIQTDFISTVGTNELTDDNFKQLTNYNIQSYQNDGLSFRLIYNKRSGYSYKFKIHVKIEA